MESAQRKSTIKNRRKRACFPFSDYGKEEAENMLDQINAFAADIDCTLSTKDGMLPEPNYHAIEMLHQHGVLVGLATGRELTDRMLQFGNHWKLDFEFDFLIGMNGGMIWDLKSRKMESMNLMNTNEMLQILEWLMPVIRKYHAAVNCEGGKNRSCMNFEPYAEGYYQRHGEYLKDAGDDPSEMADEPAYKILFRTDLQGDKELRNRFNDNGDLCRKWQMIETYPGTMEVMQKGISKGRGLRRYAEEYGLDLNHVIAFGDNENDLDLLTTAGWGVCLKDGSDQIKYIADDITDYNCMEGGVGRYLEKHYFLPKGYIKRPGQ
jgi:Cof subfamily protein (haloacid dehalogenase superfamily)